MGVFGAPGLGAGNLESATLVGVWPPGGPPPGVIRCFSELLFCGLGTGKFISETLLGVFGVFGPVYFGGIWSPPPMLEEGVRGPPPTDAEGVLGPLDISGCGVVEPGIL